MWKQAFDFMQKNGRSNLDAVDIVAGTSGHIQVKRTLTYIVCGLAFRRVDDSDDVIEVLMIQEAREDCRGKWYLPAGRLEANETFEAYLWSGCTHMTPAYFVVSEGMKRELVEESGLTGTTRGVLCMEFGHSRSTWIRITFFIESYSGTLKSKPDEESLCGKWFPVEDVLNQSIDLRGGDILRLIDFGAKMFAADTNVRRIAPYVCRPTGKFLARICFYYVYRNEYHVLIRSTNDRYRLPIVEFSEKSPFLSTFQHTVSELLVNKPRVNVEACLCLEASPKPAYVHDGFCVTVLCTGVIGGGGHVTLTESAEAEDYALCPCKDESVVNVIKSYSRCGAKIF